MKKQLLAVIFSCAGLSLAAQTADYPWAVGLYGVKTEYLGDLCRFSAHPSGNKLNYTVNTIFNFEMLHGGGAVSFDRYLNRFFDVGIYASYGNIGFDYTDEARAEYRNFEASSLLNVNLHTRFKILGNDTHRIVPYLALGVGGLYYGGVSTKVNAATGDNYFPPEQSLARQTYITEKINGNAAFTGIVSLGVGVEWRITNRWGLRYQADFGYTFKDNADFYVHDFYSPSGNVVNIPESFFSGNDCQLQHSLGVTYSFACKKSKPKPAFAVKQPALAPAAEQSKPAPATEEKPVLVPAPVVVPTPIPAPEIVVEQAKPAPAPKEAKQKNLQGVKFATGKAALTPTSFTTLDSIAKILKENPDYQVEIKGHADITGTDAINQPLSENRAKAVANYLKRKNIAVNRIHTIGYGSTQPIADNSSKSGRTQNRRVEIVVNYEE